MGEKRQKIQYELAFMAKGRGEAPNVAGRGTEAPMANRKTKSPTSTERLMEEVCERKNLKKALKRVKANKGSPGVDGMTVEKLSGYLREHWAEIEEQLL